MVEAMVFGCFGVLRVKNYGNGCHEDVASIS